MANSAITIEGVRFSYCHLLKPQVKQGQDPKYSTTILLPKNNTVAKAAIDQAVALAIEEGVNTKWNGVRPQYIPICIYDGDGTRPSDGAPFGAECKGHWVFTASSKNQPILVDANVQTIMNPAEVYSGMYGNANIKFFAYNSAGKKGIGCALNGVQKVYDGEALSNNHITAEQAFKPVAQAGAPGYGATPGYGAPPAAPAYGNPAASAPAYGAPPATTPSYGAPAAAPAYGMPADPASAYGAPPAAPAAAPGYGVPPATPAVPAPTYGATPAAPAYGVPADSTPAYGAPPAAPASAYGAPPAAPAPAYGAPGQPYVDPTTGEYVGSYTPSGMPVAGI